MGYKLYPIEFFFHLVVDKPVHTSCIDPKRPIGEIGKIIRIVHYQTPIELGQFPLPQPITMINVLPFWPETFFFLILSLFHSFLIGMMIVRWCHRCLSSLIFEQFHFGQIWFHSSLSEPNGKGSQWMFSTCNCILSANGTAKTYWWWDIFFLLGCE